MGFRISSWRFRARGFRAVCAVAVAVELRGGSSHVSGWRRSLSRLIDSNVWGVC